MLIQVSFPKFCRTSCAKMCPAHEFIQRAGGVPMTGVCDTEAGVVCILTRVGDLPAFTAKLSTGGHAKPFTISVPPTVSQALPMLLSQA